MSMIEQFKSEAYALEQSARANGQIIKHAAALEEIAKRHGFENWRALRASATAIQVADVPNSIEMKRYRNAEWNFEVDVPTRWNEFPVNPANSPYEVNRFASHEEGTHLLIIFRRPFDPKKGAGDYMAEVERGLSKKGFGNFVAGTTKVGLRIAPTLDFERPMDDGRTWYCREYFIAEGTLAYCLGFGTDCRREMVGIFDQSAKSFVANSG